MKRATYTDEQLQTDIKQGGPKRLQAIRFIYDNNNLKTQVIRFVQKNNGNQQDGEDIFHEGIIVLDRKIRLENFNSSTNINGYLFSTCRFLWMNQVRKNTKINLTENVMTMDQIETENPGTLIFQEEQKVLLDQLLSNLGDRCKKVLNLWKLSYSMEEIAVEMSFSNAAMAKKTKYRCYRKLIDFLQEDPQLLNQLKVSYEG